MIDTNYIQSIKIKNKDVFLKEIKKMSLKEWAEKGVLFDLNISPSLAEDDEVKTKVKQLLFSESHLSRRYASLVLCDINDPLGILHLTYNSLGRHPLINQRQNNGYHNLSEMSKISLFRRLEHITEECANLLINDCLDKHGNRHFEILSSIRLRSVIDAAYAWLKEDNALSFGGAFILAMNGIDAGIDILKTCAKNWRMHIDQFNDNKYITFSGKKLKSFFNKKNDLKFYDPAIFVESSIIALSHIPDQESLDLIRFFSIPNSDFCKKIGGNSSGATIQSLIRYNYLTSTKKHRFLCTANKFFMRKKIFYYNGKAIMINIICYGNNLYPVEEAISFIDFIIEFSIKKDRDTLEYIQDILISKIPAKLLFKKTVGGNCFMGLPMISNIFNDFLADITPSDIALAATEWIAFPEKYRCGYLREGFGARNL
jgi:hypothetical protein